MTYEITLQFATKKDFEAVLRHYDNIAYIVTRYKKVDDVEKRLIKNWSKYRLEQRKRLRERQKKRAGK